MYDRYTVQTMLEDAVGDGPTQMTHVIDLLLTDSEISHQETMRWMRTNRSLLPETVAGYYFPVANGVIIENGEQTRADQLLSKLNKGEISELERHVLTRELEKQTAGHLV